MLATKWRSWGARLGLVSFIAMGGAIAVFGDCASAQITPDGTLGAESSVVTPNVINGISSDQIDGGAKRGVNLFHSFREFNIDEGRGAYFTNPDGIANILSRVTGGNPSNILGTLGVRGGSANLFLINPNGIIFGPASSLDVGGSFVATTANTIGFAEQGFFSASAPDVPPVLTVNPSAFLFNQIAHGAIANSSTAPAGLSASGANVLGLRVPDGQSLLLVGGDISIDGGRLNALGGRVELGGLSGLGILELEINSHTFRLSFPPDSLLSNVTLANDARVGVRGSGGGDIVVNANAFTATGGGRLVAGTEGLGDGGDITVNAHDFTISGVGTSELRTGLYNQVLANAVGDAGDIFVNTSSFSASSSATVRSTVQSGGKGNGGDIEITTGSLSLTSGAQLAASTFGVGDAGNVTIQARDTISFDGDVSNLIFSSALSTVEEGAVGKGGDINITTGSLSVTNGAALVANTFGQGDAGDVTITASDTVSFDGEGVNGDSSGVGSQVGAEAIGKGGDIYITARSLSVTNGAQLSSATFGQGDAGDVTITISDTVSFDGVGKDGFSSLVSTIVAPGVVGRGGDINITARSLSVMNGALLSARTLGQGDAGDVTITASDTVSFDGVGSNGLSSGLFTTTVQRASGQGGDVTVTSSAFRVADGAVVNAQTFNSSKGGNVTINANTFEATNGGQVLTSTRSSGRAGNITLNVTDSATLSGSDPTYADRLTQFGENIVTNEGPASGLFANTTEESTGQGGSIMIETGRLNVRDGAEVNVSSAGAGAAGNLTVSTGSIRLDNQALLRANTTAGQGNITLRSEDLVLRRGSNITTNATGTATGGNIIIDTGVIVALENSDITANADEASGGQVRINAQGIFGTEFRETENPATSDITATSELGSEFSGTVEINTSNVDLNQGLITLPVELVNVEGLIANSCIARSGEQRGNFNITGAGGLPTRPGDAAISPYPTGTVRSIPSNDALPSSSQTSSVQSTNKARRWKMGDPIVEPQGVYRLANGELVMSRECSH